MKSYITAFYTLCLLAILSLLAASTSQAQVTALVNYQGKLKKHGTNENGQVSIVFKVFTDPTNNNCVYQESQQVNVVYGLYSTLIGQNPTLGTIQDATMLDNAYLEVSINGNTLSPREKFCPPPFASRATTVLTPTGIVNEPPNYYDVLYNRINGQMSGGANNVFNYPSCICTLLIPPQGTQHTVSSLSFNMIANGAGSYPTNIPLMVWVSARDANNTVLRHFGQTFITNAANIPINTWISIPISTNSADCVLNSDEFTCFEFDATNNPSSQGFGLFSFNVTAQMQVK